MTGYNRVVQQARADAQDIADGVSGVPNSIADQCVGGQHCVGSPAVASTAVCVHCVVFECCRL
jgi:hypothetical protein